MGNLVILCFILVFMSGCSLNVSRSDGEEDIYKIAVAAPQFGPYKELGLSIVNGAELAVELKNQNGGINNQQIKLVKVDDGGLVGEGTWRAQNLVSEMILGVVGHLHSDISIPASEIYSKAMIAEITPASTSPFFTERKPVQGYVFRTIGRDDEQGKEAAEFAKDKNFKKIAILYNNRSYGLSLASEFVKEIDENMKEADIVFYQMYEVDNKDYSREVIVLKQKSPDFIFFVGEYGDAARFLKKLRANGLNTAFLGSEAVLDKEFISSSNNASEGAFVLSVPDISDKTFVQKYKERFKKEISAFSANSFDATNILISAIEKAKEKNPEKVAKIIRETKDFPGVSGKITFDSKGDLANPHFSFYQVKSGMFVSIK